MITLNEKGLSIKGIDGSVNFVNNKTTLSININTKDYEELVKPCIEELMRRWGYVEKI